jgi:Fe2+ or Zn2+ uptake regulation protein
VSEAGRSIADDGVDDAVVQADVLHFLLMTDGPISAEELLREMAQDRYGPYSTDAVRRAVRDLVHVGLLHHEGSFVLPSRAARHFASLPR